MKILVVEDNPKHRADAQKIVTSLCNCEVHFATTWEAARNLAAQHEFETAILDVFTPEIDGGDAESSDGAVAFSKELFEKGIHHVFCTSGNHHGEKYHRFKWNLGIGGWSEDATFLSTQQIIESYPDHEEEEADTKQWQGALRYVILANSMLALPDKGAEILNRKHGYTFNSVRTHYPGSTGIYIWFGRGDYGCLTKTLEQISEYDEYAASVFAEYGL